MITTVLNVTNDIIFVKRCQNEIRKSATALLVVTNQGIRCSSNLWNVNPYAFRETVQQQLPIIWFGACTNRLLAIDLNFLVSTQLVLTILAVLHGFPVEAFITHVRHIAVGVGFQCVAAVRSGSSVSSEAVVSSSVCSFTMALSLVLTSIFSLIKVSPTWLSSSANGAIGSEKSRILRIPQLASESLLLHRLFSRRDLAMLHSRLKLASTSSVTFWQMFCSLWKKCSTNRAASVCLGMASPVCSETPRVSKSKSVKNVKKPRRSSPKHEINIHVLHCSDHKIVGNL